MGFSSFVFLIRHSVGKLGDLGSSSSYRVLSVFISELVTDQRRIDEQMPQIGKKMKAVVKIKKVS